VAREAAKKHRSCLRMPGGLPGQGRLPSRSHAALPTPTARTGDNGASGEPIGPVGGPNR